MSTIFILNVALVESLLFKNSYYVVENLICVSKFYIDFIDKKRNF